MLKCIREVLQAYVLRRLTFYVCHGGNFLIIPPCVAIPPCNAGERRGAREHACWEEMARVGSFSNIKAEI
jgi:hypothetical protein